MGTENDSYDAAKTIKQTCDDMVDGYVELVEAGEGTLKNIKSTIGQLTQYKHTFVYEGGHTSVAYRDDRMGFWERALLALGGTAILIEEQPHPERQKAYDALAETQGIVDEVDEKFELDSEDMRDTVGSVADHMGGWVDTVAQLSGLIFPSSASQVSTTGDTSGWRSPSALETYKENVQLQDAAHESTQTIIRTMLERDATFLQNMADHLSKFADLQREHEQRYIDMATGSWKPEELSLDWVLGKIGEVATFVQDHRNKQTAEAAAMIGVLNDAVTGTLKTEQLRGDINAMSEPTGDGGTGWPMPANLSAYKQAGTTGSYELEFNTRWFKDHITFWSGLSSDLGPVISTGAGVPAIEPMFLQFPGFSATATSGLNTLAGEINSKALARAQAATKDMSEKLDTTIRTYLEGEGLNAAEAKKLQDLLDE